MKKRKWMGIGGAILATTLAVTAFSYRAWLRSGTTLPDFPVELAKGQKGVLHLTVRGDKATGLLHIGEKPAISWLPGAAGWHLIHHFGNFPHINVPLPPGDYALQGLFDPPVRYRVVGRFPAPFNEFSVGGELPTDSKPGYYVVVVAGKVASGPLSASGDSPPATPAPARTAAPRSPYQLNLQLSEMRNSPELGLNFQLPLDFCHLPGGRQPVWTTSFAWRTGRVATQVVFCVQPPEGARLQAGQKYRLVPGSGNSLTYSEFGAERSADRDWDSYEGTLQIEAVKGGVARFSLHNVRMKAREGGKAQGTFTLNASGQLHAMAP